MDVLNQITGWLSNLLAWGFQFLPESPFQSLLTNTPVVQYLGYVAYFVDVQYIVNATGVWLAAIAIYYVYMAVLRWVKAMG